MITPKETYKRAIFAEKMKKKVAALDKKMIDLRFKQDQLMETCPHYHSSYRNRGNSGNWDRGDDYYWREYQCDDCGKRWNTDQTWEEEKKYPYSVNRTHEK